jgi:hypothetical protein
MYMTRLHQAFLRTTDIVQLSIRCCPPPLLSLSRWTSCYHGVQGSYHYSHPAIPITRFPRRPFSRVGLEGSPPSATSDTVSVKDSAVDISIPAVRQQVMQSKGSRAHPPRPTEKGGLPGMGLCKPHRAGPTYDFSMFIIMIKSVKDPRHAKDSTIPEPCTRKLTRLLTNKEKENLDVAVVLLPVFLLIQHSTLSDPAPCLCKVCGVVSFCPIKLTAVSRKQCRDASRLRISANKSLQSQR